MGRLSNRDTDFGTCTQCVRYTFIGFNIFGAVLSVLGIIVSILSIASANSDYNNSVAGGVIFLIACIFSLGLCVIGIIGGLLMNRLFLIIYAIILGLIVLLEFASAVTSFVFADRARDVLEDYFLEAIENYRFNRTDAAFDETSQDNLEDVQDALECCGVNGASDWVERNPQAVENNGNIPPNCTCNVNFDNNCMSFTFRNETSDTNGVWDEGCLDTLDAFVRAYYIAVGVISLIIMFVEILFVVIAVGLTVTITKKLRNHTV